MTNIAIRVDASAQIGIGHFMRCLTLADALQQRGARIRFVCRHLPEHLREMLLARAHQFTRLDGKPADADSNALLHADWLGTSQRADARESAEALSDQAWDWVIVDHYALDANWESALRPATRNIMVIDDLADRQHECDALLDQNLYSDMADRYPDRVPPECRLWLGPRYALLRQEFRRLHEHVRTRSGPVRRLLVFFGGSDPGNYTGRAIEAIEGADIDAVKVDVVIGAQHANGEQIRSACAQHGFECHVQTDRIAELMAAADLAIGAGGSATWERCSVGLPTFAISVAHNQRQQVADAASAGLLYAPAIQGDLTTAITRHVRALMENDHLREFISRSAMRAVDGRGVLRVVGNLGYSGLEMRRASVADERSLFEWRNDPAIRKSSRNSETIGWEDHQKWFASVTADPQRLLLIGQRDNVARGVVRFDIQGQEAEVSIYVVPGVQDPGLGRDLLLTAERWLAVHRPQISKVHAHVLGNNARSQFLFSGSEYQVESTSYSKRLQ